MRPKRIILIRHGESEGNANPQIYATKADHKICLTRNGREQALAAGVKLKELIGEETIQYYVSTHLRTKETFNCLLSSGLPAGKVKYDPRLREQEWGHFRTVEETEKIQEERYRYGTFHYRFPNGESGANVYDRVTAFLETMHRDFSRKTYPENTLIVTHGLTIRLFVMRWFHKEPEDFESWANPGNCEFFVMSRKPPRFEGDTGDCFDSPVMKLDEKREAKPA